MSTTNTRDFALGNSHMRLMPWYVTGIVDGEGSFNISISNVNRIRFEFKVTQKRLNAGILYDLERFFGVGSVVIDNRSDDTMKYHVTDHKALVNVIVPHFLNYPLVTSKKLNFLSFREALYAVTNDVNNVVDYIKTLKADMNKGRSFADKFNAISVISLQPEWVQAFVDGEGTFYPYVALKKSRNKTYQGVDLSLEIGQASHDVGVLASLVKFFNGGFVSPKCDITSLDRVQAIRAKSIYKLRDVNTVIKFFNEYPLLTNKQLDFDSFKAIWNIKSTGGHNTIKGLEKILELKKGMNKGRNIKQNIKQINT